MEGQIDIWAIMLSSGIVVKFVLLLLIAASVLSWTIIWQKKKQFEEIKEQDKKFLEKSDTETDLDKLYQSSFETTKSNFAVIYQETLTEYNELKDKLGDDFATLRSYFSKHSYGLIERAIEVSIKENSIKLDYRLSLLASIATVTPFIGLFGTVWGIIDSFAGLAQGGGSIEAVAPGIAEALVATAVGLAAAIPASWFYNYYSSHIASMETEMENFGQRLLNRIENSLLG